MAEKYDYYQFLIDTLKSWGITLYTGVTGGGVIHYLKYLDTLHDTSYGKPEFFTFGEYNAGFVPLGYYLASGKIAAAVATTGAATKLLACGLSDAKLHDIPAVYIVPVSAKNTLGCSPLQDTSIYGSNMIEQLRAELPNSVFVLDDPSILAEQLALAKALLDNSKPVVFVLVNESLNIPVDEVPAIPAVAPYTVENGRFDDFTATFRQAIDGKRLVVLVGEEMTRYADALELTSAFSEQFRAAVIWSINGANAVRRDNPYGYGYIAFGGNDKALNMYDSLGDDDVLMVLGACPDEYTVNLNLFTASHTFFVGNIPKAYGLVKNSLFHIAKGKYYHMHSAIDMVLRSLIDTAKQQPFTNIPAEPAPEDLNNSPFPIPGNGYVDMVKLYQQLDKWWPAGSIGFDDVCLSYKDRQYVTQRPNNNIHFYSLYRGSAMGGAFGVAVGAKLSKPEQPVFLFTGDGCFRLFSGSLGEVSDLGLVVFLLNNETLSIVEQGLIKILPGVPEERYHSALKPVDYCSIARAYGWDAEKLNPDLSNFNDLLVKKRSRSLLIEVAVDPHQILGANPRLRNL